MNFFKKLFKAILIIIAIILIIIAIYFVWAYIAAAASTVATTIGTWASGLSWASAWAGIVGTNWGFYLTMAFVLSGFLKRGSAHNTSSEPEALPPPSPILTGGSNVPGTVDIIGDRTQYGLYGMLLMYSTVLLHTKGKSGVTA